jgi:hypothetical protein
LKDEKGKKEGMKGIRFMYRSSHNYSEEEEEEDDEDDEGEEEDELFHDNLDEDHPFGPAGVTHACRHNLDVPEGYTYKTI